MAPTPPNFAAFAESLLTAYGGDQQAAHTALSFAALLGALDLDNDTPTAEEPEAEEPTPEPEPEPTVSEPPLALAAVTATCEFTKKKKRCRNKPKKGSTNALCALRQPSPEPSGTCQFIFGGEFGGDRLRKRVVWMWRTLGRPRGYVAGLFRLHELCVRE